MSKKKVKKKNELSSAERSNLQAEYDEYAKLREEAKATDPFWYFEPSDGTITPGGQDLIEEFLREDDWPVRVDGQLDAMINVSDILGVSGGNQCLGGETKIYDPITRISKRVDEIDSGFHVYAWDEKKKKRVIAKALKPFTKPVDDLYEFTLSNNKKFVASMSHLVLTQKGYLSLHDVVSESLPILRATNSDTYLLAHGVDGRRSLKKAVNFLFDCQAYLRLCGERSLLELDIDQDASPLQADVHGHKGQVFLQKGGLWYKQVCTHLYQSLSRLSSLDVGRHLLGHVFETLYRIFYMPFLQVCPKPQEESLLLGALDHQFQSTASFLKQASHNDNQSSSCSTFNTSSLVPSLEVINVTHRRRDVKYDFTVPKYHNYELAGCIHHNSGKTTTEIITGYIKSTGELPQFLEPYREHFKEDIERAQNKFVRGRVLAIDFKQLNNTVIYWWRHWCPRKYLKNGKWSDSYSVQFNTLTLYRNKKPCSQVEFMTNQQDIDSFQGPPLDWLMNDEEGKEKIYEENLLRFVTSDRLDVGFYWTPTHGISWATDMFSEDMTDTGDSISLVKLSAITNKKANLATLRNILLRLNPRKVKDGPDYEMVKMRLLGEVISLSGLIYGRSFDKKTHLIDPFFEDLDVGEKKRYLTFCGMDPHQSTPTAMVFMLMDWDGNCYLDLCKTVGGDTEDIKNGWNETTAERGYRMGFSVADKSSNMAIPIRGIVSMFDELKRGSNRINNLRLSSKWGGSIREGVDEIKKRLRSNENTDKPTFFIVNRPENKELIKSFQTMERDTYANEDDKGPKDRIKEGKHHYHAALRYIFQYPLNWYEADVESHVPQPEFYDEAVCY